jgi:hypothetical protein
MKSITMVSLSTQAPTSYQWDRVLLFIHKWVELPMKRAHAKIEEGAPSGGICEPSVRERAATSPHIHASVKTAK